MPQATDELRAEFPGDDAEALLALEVNFKISRTGIIYKKDAIYKPTKREWDAIDYLFQEWYYAYMDIEEPE